MKKPIIKEYEKPFKLYEESQTSGVNFAFISSPKDGSAQCHPFVKCRDFLHDAVRAHITYTKCEIYGFKYDPSIDPPIDTRRMRMHLKYVSEKGRPFAPIMERALELINHYERKMGSKIKTTCVKMDDNSYVVSGPSIWLKSPILTTLFSLFFRLAEHVGGFTTGSTDSLTTAYEEAIKAEPTNKDIKYLKSIYTKLPLITEYYKDLCDLYKNAYDPVMLAKNEINSYHNYAGVVSLCTERFVDKSRSELLKTLEEERKEGKELLRVKAFTALSPYTSYKPNDIGMAFVNVIDEVRKQCSAFTSCRESLTQDFRSRHPNADHVNKSFKIAKVNYVDDDKLRLLVRVPGVLRDRQRMAVHKKEMFFAKRVLNHYEKSLGIAKTVISTVILEHNNGVQYAWLLTSSKDWLVSPVMLSMYVTIMRAAKTFMHHHTSIDPETFIIPENINNKTVDQIWKTLFKQEKLNRANDAVICTKAFGLILKNRDVLFGKKTVEEQHFIGKNNLLPGTPDYYYSCKVGVKSLITRTHIDKKLVTKFKELEK